MDTIHATKIWLILVVLTLLSYGLSHAGYKGEMFVSLLMLTALIKGQMIIDHFMMLKIAPLIWRLIVSLWLLIILTVIALLYFSQA